MIARILQSFIHCEISGWTPKRTVVFCSFDSADIGNNFEKSWLNENSRVLTQRAVALFYIRQSVGGKWASDMIYSSNLIRVDGYFF